MEVLEAYCNSLLNNKSPEPNLTITSNNKKSSSPALEQYKHEYFDEPQSFANKRAALRWKTKKRRSSRAQLLAGELSPINNPSNNDDDGQFGNMPKSLAEKQQRALSIDPTIPSNQGHHEKQPVITAFLCNKGGTGKTTACINIAGYLASQGKKILIVDLDPQGSASTFIENPGINKPTISAELFSKVELEHLQVSKAFNNIDIIPADSNLLLAERDLHINRESPAILRTQLLALASHPESSYDYIFLDVPAGLGLLSMSATISADNIVLPVDNSSYTEGACELLLALFKQVEKHTNKKPEIAMLLLRQQAGNFLEQILREDRTRIVKLLSRYLSEEVRIVPIPYSSSCQRAARARMTMNEYAPLDKLSRAFQRAAILLDTAHDSRPQNELMQPMTEC